MVNVNTRKHVTDVVFAAIHDLGMATGKLRAIGYETGVDAKYVDTVIEKIDDIVDELRFEVTR